MNTENHSEKIKKKQGQEDSILPDLGEAAHNA